jgi:transcription elongation factor Elf1
MTNNNNSQVLPCPVCKNDIHFDTLALLQGAQFVCINCEAKISLQADAIPQAKDVFNKFNEVKEMIKKRPDKTHF